MKKYLSLGFVLLGFLNLRASDEGSTQGQLQAVDYASPMSGTGGTGHTYPGAVFPFGMVQLSPDTGVMSPDPTGDVAWAHCSGYYYTDTTIIGFSHTHLSGTG